MTDVEIKKTIKTIDRLIADGYKKKIRLLVPRHEDAGPFLKTGITITEDKKIKFPKLEIIKLD